MINKERKGDCLIVSVIAVVVLIMVSNDRDNGSSDGSDGISSDGDRLHDDRLDGDGGSGGGVGVISNAIWLCW